MAQAASEIGWGVVGVGLAGRARARAIQADERCHLVGVSRGRFAAEFDVPNRDFDALINDVDAMAVCSPTRLHAEHARRALEAGCHTLVEFPLAECADEARALFDLANTRGRILHVEHIELLLAPFQTLKERLRGHLEVSMHMTKKGTGDEDFLAMYGATVARLHNLHDLRSILSVGEVLWSPGRLEVELRLDNGEARLVVEYGPTFARQTEVSVRDEHALWSIRKGCLHRDDQRVAVEASQVALFAQDHNHMMARLNENKAPYVSPERVIAILGHLEAIAASVGGST